jgi:hypothetical protein
MDAIGFDTLTRTLTDTRSRRGSLASLLGGALGLFGLTQAEAKKKKRPCPPCKKRRKGKCKATLPDGTACASGTCQRGSCVAPSCRDGTRNGNETDIDCGGGSCPRCINGQSCFTRNDCAGAYCLDTVCQECLTDVQCPNDAHGQCSCQVLAEQPVVKRACVNWSQAHPVKPTCAECPPGTTCVQSAGGVECPKPCGAP